MKPLLALALLASLAAAPQGVEWSEKELAKLRTHSPLGPPPPAWLDHAELPSNAATYVVHVDPSPATLPDNEPFALEVWIADAREPARLCPGLTLAVDAAMPEHGHGMNRVPKITELEPGHFRVEGLLFHMTGHWELYFDVTREAVTERAQTDVMLE